ncbi:MAG TPA: fatty acid desaturase [Burkholderiales bacterium]|nr:fatty acid desaturase [Burkholderiales bacterium]
MGAYLIEGLLDLPWWGYVLAALALTHVTIAAVTIFLHRAQAHRALDLHPAVSHFLRFWLWLTTGMVTREWVAVHRKHHAKCDTPEDPHSPRIYGIARVLFGGVFLYVAAARDPHALERYGQGTPDDRLERHLYSKYQSLGLILMGVVDVVVFGIGPGLLILLAQIVWIPFWAAGVINGAGHYWGYRHWSTPDWSTNIIPWGILIGGEELHNNHHAFATSAKLSNKWYEIDLGWGYIRLLQAAGLAKVKHVPPRPLLAAPKPVVDPQTLQAVIANRYAVLAEFGRSLWHIYTEEIRKLRRTAPEDAVALERLEPLLDRDEKILGEDARRKLAETLPKSSALQTVYAMRHELAALWGRSLASREQLVAQLQDWCRRAEASGIQSLAEFSLRLRSYA